MQSKTRHRYAGYANACIRLFYFGRLQSVVRLIPDDLVLRSKIGLDNRFLPRTESSSGKAYLTARFMVLSCMDALKALESAQSENRPSG